MLKILKHSTDTLPPPNPQTSFQADRNPPPYTELGSHPDALGVLLGLDLDGVLEVEDSFALPAGETSLGGEQIVFAISLTGSQLVLCQTPTTPARGPNARFPSGNLPIDAQRRFRHARGN